MKITIIVQNIKDPVKFTGHFLNKLSQLFKEPLDVFVFTDTDKNLYPNYTTHTLNLAAVKHAKANEAQTGERTAANIQKQIDVSKKLGRKHTSWALLNEHLQFLSLYQSQFSKIRPDLLLIWNGITHSFQTAATEAAQMFGIPVVYLERGLLPGSVFYDFQGVNAESAIGRDAAWQYRSDLLHDDKVFPTVRQIVLETGGGLVADTAHTSKIAVQDYLFFPLQRDTDSNMLFNSPYVKNMYSILNSLNLWRQQEAVATPVLVRPHPEDPANHYTKHINFSHLNVQADGGLLETIQKAAAVMTVNSTVGFTSLILDKVVIALGNSVYNHRALCFEPQNMDELQQMLSQPESWQLDADIVAKRYDFIGKLIANSHVSFQHEALYEIQTASLQQQLFARID